MNLPQVGQIYDTETSEVWITSQNILCSKAKEGAVYDVQKAQAGIDFKDWLRQGKRFYFLTDATGVRKISFEARRLFMKDLNPQKYHAIAIVAKNQLSRIIASMALGLNRLNIPVKVVTSWAEGEQWLLELQGENVAREVV